MKTNKLTTLGLVALLVLVGGLAYYAAQNSDPAPRSGGFIPQTVTNTSTTVGMLSTVVHNSTDGLQKAIYRNIGAGQIFCGFKSTTTATVTLDTGYEFSVANTTSTSQEREITDPALLQKYMICIANTTSTFSVLKYASN